MNNTEIVALDEELRIEKKVNELRDLWIDLIQQAGPFAYLLTVTTCIQCRQNEAWEALDFLIRILNVKLFGKKYINKDESEGKCLKGIVFAEKQGYGNLHFHIILNANPYFNHNDLEKHLYENLDRVKKEVKAPVIRKWLQKKIYQRKLKCTNDVLNDPVIKTVRQVGKGVYRKLFDPKGVDLTPVYSERGLIRYLTKTMERIVSAKELPTRKMTNEEKKRRDKLMSDSKKMLFSINAFDALADAKPANTYNSNPENITPLEFTSIDTSFICEIGKTGVKNKAVCDI